MLQRPAPRLILASASTSRHSVLQAAGLEFATRPADLDEGEIKRSVRTNGGGAEAAALRLAEQKAMHAASLDPKALVIGADQILVCGTEWFDKPVDGASAAAQLRTLRGRTHTLVTAVLCLQGGRSLWH